MDRFDARVFLIEATAAAGDENGVVEPTTQEIQILQPPVPVYVPTPKHILEGRKTNGVLAPRPDVDHEQVKKKPRLEYVPKPMNPEKTISDSTPVYVPTALTDHIDIAIDEYIDSTQKSEDVDDLSGIATELLFENECKDQNTESQIKTVGKSADSENKREKSESSRKHSHSDRHKHGSSKESSHRSSSSSKHKSSHHSSSSQSKSKHSEKDRVRKKRTEDRSSSKDSKSSTSSHKHSSSRKSSGSSRRKTHEHHSKSKSGKEAVVYATDSEVEEDDIEAQCRMIFDEFDPSTVVKGETLEDDDTPAVDSLAKYDDFNKKKRVAHDNADTKPLLSFTRSSNHVHNAMQVFLVV